MLFNMCLMNAIFFTRRLVIRTRGNQIQLQQFPLGIMMGIGIWLPPSTLISALILSFTMVLIGWRARPTRSGILLNEDTIRIQMSFLARFARPIPPSWHAARLLLTSSIVDMK